jgi:hypothetical protein
VAAAGQLHAARPAVAAGDLGDLDATAQVDHVVAVQVGEDLRGLPAEHPQQRQLPPLQHGHLDAGGAAGGRGLQPDPAGADHRHPRRGTKGVLDPVAVGYPAQVEHPVQLGAWHR